jgi:ankyrin repeat protein
MGNSGSITSSDKGEKFLVKFLYVDHVDKEMGTASETPDPYIRECKLADRTKLFDMSFTEYRKSPKAKHRILNFFIRERIDFVTVYNSNPKPSDIPNHEFVVFKTVIYWFGDLLRTWWSLERNGQQIVFQRSKNKDDVINKIYDTETKTSVERLGPIKKQKIYLIEDEGIVNVLRMMWENQQISEPYHLLFFNCPNFETFVVEKLRKKWSTMTSAIVDRIGLKKKKIQPKIIAQQYRPENKKLFSFDEIDINSMNPTGDTSLHLALNGEEWELAEEILKRFESYDVNITNSVGDTPLLLAARLKCEIGLFKQILKRTNSENVNKTDRYGNTALHYAMLKKSETEVEELLKREDVDVDIKNRYDGSALHLASKWTNIQMELFNLILEKTTDTNAQDNNGWTALHCAIIMKSETAIKALLAHNDVNVNVKTNHNDTALIHFASTRNDIPSDLFKLILEKSTDINAQDEEGETVLHTAILCECDIGRKELLSHKDVNVNLKNNRNETALHLTFKRFDFPSDLFNLILEKSTEIDAQNISGWTALHCAIICKSEIATKTLLKHKGVNVNVKDKNNKTALGYVSMWKDIPSDLFKLISERSANEAKEK